MQDFDQEKKAANMLAVAEKWLGTRCLAGWPNSFRATVTKIMTETAIYELPEGFQGEKVTPDAIVVTAKKAEESGWQKVSQHLAYQYSKRMGILLGPIDAVAVVRPDSRRLLEEDEILLAHSPTQVLKAISPDQLPRIQELEDEDKKQRDILKAAAATLAVQTEEGATKRMSGDLCDARSKWTIKWYAAKIVQVFADEPRYRLQFLESDLVEHVPSSHVRDLSLPLPAQEGFDMLEHMDGSFFLDEPAPAPSSSSFSLSSSSKASFLASQLQSDDSGWKTTIISTAGKQGQPTGSPPSPSSSRHANRDIRPEFAGKGVAYDFGAAAASPQPQTQGKGPELPPVGPQNVVISHTLWEYSSIVESLVSTKGEMRKLTLDSAGKYLCPLNSAHGTIFPQDMANHLRTIPSLELKNRNSNLSLALFFVLGSPLFSHRIVANQEMNFLVPSAGKSSPPRSQSLSTSKMSPPRSQPAPASQILPPKTSPSTATPKRLVFGSTTETKTMYSNSRKAPQDERGNPVLLSEQPIVMKLDRETGLTVCPFHFKHMMPPNSMKKHLIREHFKEMDLYTFELKGTACILTPKALKLAEEEEEEEEEEDMTANSGNFYNQPLQQFEFHNSPSHYKPQSPQPPQSQQQQQQQQQQQPSYSQPQHQSPQSQPQWQTQHDNYPQDTSYSQPSQQGWEYQAAPEWGYGAQTAGYHDPHQTQQQYEQPPQHQSFAPTQGYSQGYSQPDQYGYAGGYGYQQPQQHPQPQQQQQFYAPQQQHPQPPQQTQWLLGRGGQSYQPPQAQPQYQAPSPPQLQQQQPPQGTIWAKGLGGPQAQPQYHPPQMQPPAGRGRGAAAPPPPAQQYYQAHPTYAPSPQPVTRTSSGRGLPRLEQWLPAIGLGELVNPFYANGFDSVEMLLEFTPHDWEELAQVLQLPLGHKMKLRREVDKLRV